MEKYKVVIAFQREDGHEYPRIYAESRQQAEQIALQMFEEDRRDFHELLNVRACAMDILPPKPIKFENLLMNTKTT